jgi:anti-sigma factor RsiW
MTHLGQRLSALIDGELDGSERERVLVHMARCGSCRDEVASLRMLKRRMNALGEAAAGAGLTGRLMSLSELMGLDDPRLSGGMSPGETTWPPLAPAGSWPVREHPGQGATAAGHASRPDQRTGRYFLAGSVAVFLAGLGTAAFIVGGEPQAKAPAPPVTPSIDVLVFPQHTVNQAPEAGLGSARFQPRPELPGPAATAFTFRPEQP